MATDPDRPATLDAAERCRVTVVIPARDAASSLAAAVASALDQTRPVEEIVIAAADPATRAEAQRLASADPATRSGGQRPTAADPEPGAVAQHSVGEYSEAQYPEAHNSAASAGPHVIVVDNPAGGTSAGLNAAIAAATGDIIVRLDAHARLPRTYVAVACATLDETKAANVGGRQVPVASSGFARAVAAAMRSPFGAGGAAYRTGSTPGPVDTVYLGVYRREALEQVGGFDERFVRNQDAELNVRLAAAGLTVWFDPRLEVAYEPRDSLAGLARQYFEYGRWRRATARTHRGSLRARQMAAPTVVVGLMVAAAASIAFGAPWLFALAAGSYAGGLLIGGIIAVTQDLRSASAHGDATAAATGDATAGATAGDATAAATAGATAGEPRIPWWMFVTVAVALATMHLAWGVGFLLGPGRAVQRSRPDGR